MKKNIFWLLVLVCLAFQAPSPKVRLFIAGDSTAQGYDETQTLMRGWGQLLPDYFTPEVEIINRAKAGRSTKSFQDEGRWDEIIKDVRKGDYVFIQFGHNDTSNKPERYASPDDYRKNLLRFINDVRERKAKPILLTSIVMRTFVDGNLVDDRLKIYPGIVREIAYEYDVPLIDLNLQTRDMILKLGDEHSKTLYMWVKPGEDLTKPEGSQDDTHTREEGARRIAALIAKSINDLKLKPLCKYLKQDCLVE